MSVNLNKRRKDTIISFMHVAIIRGMKGGVRGVLSLGYGVYVVSELMLLRAIKVASKYQEMLQGPAIRLGNILP